jgi:hypothetical protein
VKFGTLEYYKKLAEIINIDETISKSHIDTTVLIVFEDVKTAEGANKAFLIRFEDGKVAEVREAKPDEDAEFTISATYSIHAGIAKGELDPLRAKIWYKSMMKAARSLPVLRRLGEILREMKDVEY